MGAGTGLVAEYLIRGGVDVIDALDLSDEMLGVARMKGFYRHLIAADVLPFCRWFQATIKALSVPEPSRWVMLVLRG